MTILKHIPALQILIPFFAALFSVLTFHKFASWVVATVAVALSLALGIYAYSLSQDTIFYNFGDWQGAIGIEYRIDSLNQPIIIYLNAVLLFFLICGKQLINQTITKYIDQKRHHMFYSLLLFAHAGYLGVLSTNDLFNIYVFIEISSLATYVLMSKGNNPKSLVGSFDYLMLGTIGATMILIAVGLFFAITGSLNITDISDVVQNNFSFVGSKPLTAAIVFFLSGAILKMAFFPLHFWMIRAYGSVAPFILTYLAAISSIIGVYLIMRFMYFTIEAQLIYVPVTLLLRIMAIATVLICTYLALKSKDIKSIIIYSSASQVGYIFLILSVWSAKWLLFQLLILDSINKIGLFTLIAHIQNKSDDLHIDSLKRIKGSVVFKVFAAFVILFSAGMPVTSMFFVKIKLFEVLIKENLIIDFIVVMIGSVCALLYHMKFAKAIFFAKEENGIMHIETHSFGLVAIVFVHVLTLVYIGDLWSILPMHS